MSSYMELMGHEGCCDVHNWEGEEGSTYLSQVEA